MEGIKIANLAEVIKKKLKSNAKNVKKEQKEQKEKQKKGRGRMNKTKEILEKQLDLLSECSQLCDDTLLASITEQMLGIARMLEEQTRKEPVETISRENSGSWNSGHCNSGSWNSGHGNSGDRNSGDRNSGFCNSGSWNSGHWNSDDWNSGNGNSGSWNSGHCNSGSWNSGHWNSGDYNSGFFNAQTPKISLFDKETDLSMEEIMELKGIQVLFDYYKNTIWIDEQQEHPEYQITRGYLKTVPYKKACQLMWDELTEEEKQEVTRIPNFNAKIFKKITGIEVDK